MQIKYQEIADLINYLHFLHYSRLQQQFDESCERPDQKIVRNSVDQNAATVQGVDARMHI